MKTVPLAVSNALKQDHAVEVKAQVIIEWNHNSMFRTSVDNTPAEYDEGYDTEMFPVESITFPNRPETSGIAKAVAGLSFAVPERHPVVPAARFYACSQNDEYKYWQSPAISDTVAVTGSYPITKVAPQVLYVEENNVADLPVGMLIWANKISFTVENSYTTPVSYDVQIKSTVAGVWTTVSSNVIVPTTGKVELWYDGTSIWKTVKTTAFQTRVHGVRLVVNSMDKPNVYFNLIELGFRLELDASKDVVSTSSAASMGEQDFITPLGTISSNTGSLALFNEDGLYDDKNINSILFGMMDKGVKFTIGYNFTVSGVVYYVQEAVLFSESWEETDADVTVALVDGSRYLQEIKPRRVLYRNMLITEIIWRLCDIVGFNSYKVVTASAPVPTIPFFWTDSDKTLWETFQELSRATQTAIYFDSYGVLQIKPRDVAYQRDKTPVGLLNRDVSGTNIPNIISLTDAKQYEANKVKINYRPAKFDDLNYYITPYTQVWEPEDTVVLRASELASDFAIDQMTVFIQPKDAETWPYKGMFNIQGEKVSYEGKEYQYRNQGVTSKVIIKSVEDKKKYDDTTFPNEIHMNGCTGKMIITERGAYNSDPVAHPVKPAGWRTHRVKNYGVTRVSSGSSFVRTESCATLNLSSGNTNDYLYLNRGNKTFPQPKIFGTSIRIDKSNHRNKIGGIFFAADASGNGGLGAGYYVEVAATVTFKGEKRKTSNEIAVYSMKSNGSKKVYGGMSYVVKDKSKDNDKDTKNVKKKVDIGARSSIVQGFYNDLDVVFTPGTNDQITVYINGTQVISATIPGGSGWQHVSSGLWGLYARGQSKVSFDYAYAVQNPGGVNPATGAQYLDRLTGGYRSNFAMLDVVYNSRLVKPNRKKNKKIKQTYEFRFFDEFGPILHEMRDFDVEFTTEEPVVQSKLYLSNLSQSVPLNFASDNGSAQFTLVNTSRSNAVLSGDDELTARGFGTINQKLFVYGRPVKITEDQFIEKKDDFAIRRRGEIEVEYDTPWIQTKGEAENLATWLVENWRTSDSALQVETFGNPTWELTDVLTVNHLTTQGTYYVVAIENTFDTGINTTLTLRKT